MLDHGRGRTRRMEDPGNTAPRGAPANLTPPALGTPRPGSTISACATATPGRSWPIRTSRGQGSARCPHLAHHRPTPETVDSAPSYDRTPQACNPGRRSTRRPPDQSPSVAVPVAVPCAAVEADRAVSRERDKAWEAMRFGPTELINAR